MKKLVEYLDFGNVYKNKDAAVLRITKLDDLNDKVIPFFKKHPIQGVKLLDYLDFVKVAELMKSQDHLTKDGLDDIRKIKAGMDKGRKIYSVSHRTKIRVCAVQASIFICMLNLIAMIVFVLFLIG